MRTVYFLLLLIFTGCGNEIIKNNISTTESEFLDDETNSNTISGLKIVPAQSKKLGKVIYIVSDSYAEKTISFYNEKGRKVYSKKTVGSPIQLSKFKKGTYRIEVTEGQNTETREITVN